MNPWRKFEHFSLQLSTFPTCTESAAILVLNQILQAERRGGGAPKTSFPLWRHKNGVNLTEPSLMSETRRFPCRRRTFLAAGADGSPGGLDGSEPPRKSVPLQSEQERRWFGEEASAQRSCGAAEAPTPAGTDSHVTHRARTHTHTEPHHDELKLSEVNFKVLWCS